MLSSNSRKTATPRHSKRVKQVLTAAALLAALAGTAGCGFQPLYKQDAQTGYSSAKALQTVRIEPLPDRAGQMLHNHLRDRINPTGQPTQPLYTLKAKMSESTTNLAVQLDSTATRANFRMTVEYFLIERASGKVVTSGTARSTNSYDKSDDPYTTLVAEDTARTRVIKQVADDIALNLGVYFSRQQ